MFQFLAGLLSTEPTVALVGTFVTDACIFLPNLSFNKKVYKHPAATSDWTSRRKRGTAVATKSGWMTAQFA